MDDIAASVHKGKSTLYYYFNSKEEVFKAVVEKEISNYMEELEENINSCTSAIEKIESIISTRLRMANEKSNVYNIHLDDLLNNFYLFDEVGDKYFNLEKKIITAIIDEGIKKGDFIEVDPDLTSQTIIMTLKGFDYIRIKDSNFTMLEKDINSIVEILLYGIVKR